MIDQQPPLLTPFEILAHYEQRSLTHTAGLPEQVEAAGLWRGIGYRVGQRYLVSSLAEVNEILAVPHAAAVPGTRGWLLGVASVRGNLVPLIDLKQFLTGERSVVTESSRVLSVRQAAGSVGLLVDEVVGQRNFAPEQRISPSVDEGDPFAAYIVEDYSLGGTHWGQLSMVALVRTNAFIHAAL